MGYETISTLSVFPVVIAIGVAFASVDGRAMEDMSGQNAAAAGAQARESMAEMSDQDAARAGAQAGRLMNFGELRDRVGARVGGKFLGCDCNPDAARYRMRFMRGNRVIEVDVNARNGDILGTRE